MYCLKTMKAKTVLNYQQRNKKNSTNCFPIHCLFIKSNSHYFQFSCKRLNDYLPIKIGLWKMHIFCSNAWIFLDFGYDWYFQKSLLIRLIQNYPFHYCKKLSFLLFNSIILKSIYHKVPSFGTNVDHSNYDYPAELRPVHLWWNKHIYHENIF